MNVTKKDMSSNISTTTTISTNILIYSDNETLGEKLENCFKDILDCDRYTIYNVPLETLENGAWKGRTALVVIIGIVGRCIPLLDYYLNGGKILALHSDFISTLLPYYRTELRNEITLLSFGKCQSVKLKQQILLNEKPLSTATYMGHQGHELYTKVLAYTETLNIPSLLKVTDFSNKGIAIFSQIYLELDPCEYLGEEEETSNQVRLKIIGKVVKDLNLQLKDSIQNVPAEYSEGYFIGDYETKLSFIKNCCSEKLVKDIDNLTIQWTINGKSLTERPSKTFLPIHIDDKPVNFSVEEYFDNLTSKRLGHLLIYADVLTSTTEIVKEPLVHGLAVVTRRQLEGRGRGGNTWITPLGQAAISIQIWQKISPTLPLIQHATALAVVQAIRFKPYDNLDIRIKWPNDIYYGKEIKIGGIVTTADCMSDDVIINIGTGVNIFNKVPTICVNDIIIAYNEKNGTALSPISIERFLARYCSELERILDYISKDNGVKCFLKQYYRYWLHTDETVYIQTKDSNTVKGVISGIDESGWLVVKTCNGEVTVAPDGNTFDMMNGLIAAKEKD